MNRLHQLWEWFGRHPAVVMVLIVCVAVVLIAALWMRTDLGWLPQFLRDLLGL